MTMNTVIILTVSHCSLENSLLGAGSQLVQFTLTVYKLHQLILTENLVLRPFYVSFFFFSCNFMLVIEIRTECKILLKQASNKDVKKYLLFREKYFASYCFEIRRN